MQDAIEIQHPETLDQAVLYAKTKERHFANSNSSDCSYAYAQHYTEAQGHPGQADGFAHSIARMPDMGNADPILEWRP